MLSILLLMKPEEKGSKEISVTVAFETAESISSEEIASRVEKAVGGLDGEVGRISDVVVRTVPRFTGGGSGGYESRIWEKATCKVVDDPRERLIDPVTELDKLTDQAARLEQELAKLNSAIDKLKSI